MKADFIKVVGSWRDVADAARETIGKEAGEGEPSSAWKRRMLLCEHSPIRSVGIIGRWTELKSWVSVHFVRHAIGIVHWVKSQRSDRTGICRDELRQDEFVAHRIEANAQAFINISRRRLCNCASPETRQAWQAMLDAIRPQQPELVEACVPDCIYRGHCYEYKSCGWHRTEAYRNALKRYREGINP